MKISPDKARFALIALIASAGVIFVMCVIVLHIQKRYMKTLNTPVNTNTLVIVTSHFKEDLKWLHGTSWPVVVISKEGADPAALPVLAHIPNVGAEASSYFTTL